MKIAVVGGGSWGTAFSRSAARPGPRRHARLPGSRAGGGDPRDRPQPALPPSTVDLSGVAAVAGSEARLEEAELVVLAVPTAGVRGGRGALHGDAPVLSLTKGLDPATGERLSTLVPTVLSPCCPGRTWPRRSPRGCPLRPSSPPRTKSSPRSCSRRSTSLVSRVREPGRDGCRAVRRREERDRARGRRRRRARARRQREGGADHARPRRDGAAWRRVRRPAGDVLRPRRDGGPDRHLRVPSRPQPAGRRADRARRRSRGRPGADRADGGRADDRARAARRSASGSGSSCRSRRACAP